MKKVQLTFPKIAITTLAVIILSTLISPLINIQHANAIDGWNAGSIIDDAVFTDKNSMSLDQIQQFLNAKVPVCDTDGTQPATDWGRSDLTHAQFAAMQIANAQAAGRTTNWNNPPFTCLKDYIENGRKSAQIIYDAAQQYTISPKVLIVLLQKEQGLVTDTWPLAIQYRSATGYGCPDTAPCNSDYYGLTNQVNWSAHMFRAILNDSPTWSKKYYPSSMADPNTGATGARYVAYSPDGNCGGSWIDINNRSTQALYNYTPYQPNSAALNAPMGVSVDCGAYGNINFYRYFTSWFGSTTAVNGSIVISKGLTIDKSTAVVGDTITASYEVSNTADYSVQAGGLGICANINGLNYDFGSNNQNLIPAGGKITVTYSKKIDQAGSINIYTCSYLAQSGGWVSDRYPYNINGLQRTAVAQVQDNPLVTTSVTLSPASPIAGQTVTASFVVTNASSNPVDIGSLMIAARDPNGLNIDFPLTTNIVIAANSTYTYSQSRILNVSGTNTFYITRYKDGAWNANYLKAAVGVDRRITAQVR